MAAWNDAFRGDVRSFWLAGPKEITAGRPAGGIRDLATRLSGSADLFGHADPMGDHGPTGSINFIDAHDGFTLRDLVTFEHKHNLANGENNRDGSGDNRSWNHGVEGLITEGVGPSLEGSDLGMDTIARLRERSIRNLFATLAFSAGVPMYCAGDEFGRTQWGNNNAYCQDGPISWLDWDMASWQGDLVETVSFLFALRREHESLRPARYLSGNDSADGVPDLAWFGVDAKPVAVNQWHDGAFRTVQMVRHCTEPGERDALIAINGTLDEADYVLAPGAPGEAWELIWDSVWGSPGDKALSEGIEGPMIARQRQTIPMHLLSLRLYLAVPDLPVPRPQHP
jgi:glycogen operon protein